MTDAPNEHRIETMADILALSRDERLRLIPDLLLWADMVDAIRADADMAGVIAPTDHFIWVDDGNPARVAGVQIGDLRRYFDEAPHD